MHRAADPPDNCHAFSSGRQPAFRHLQNAWLSSCAHLFDLLQRRYGSLLDGWRSLLARLELK